MTGFISFALIAVSITQYAVGNHDQGEMCSLLAIFFMLCQINYNLIKGIESYFSKNQIILNESKLNSYGDSHEKHHK